MPKGRKLIKNEEHFQVEFSQIYAPAYLFQFTNHQFGSLTSESDVSIFNKELIKNFKTCGNNIFELQSTITSLR